MISSLNFVTATSLGDVFLLDFRYTLFLCLSFFLNSDKLRCRFRFWLCSLWALLAIIVALFLFLFSASNIKLWTSTDGKAACRCWILQYWDKLPASIKWTSLIYSFPSKTEPNYRRTEVPIDNSNPLISLLWESNKYHAFSLDVTRAQTTNMQSHWL